MNWEAQLPRWPHLIELYLLNQVDSVTQLLALQERMDIVEKVVKVLLLVPVGYKNG